MSERPGDVSKMMRKAYTLLYRSYQSSPIPGLNAATDVFPSALPDVGLCREMNEHFPRRLLRRSEE